MRLRKVFNDDEVRSWETQFAEGSGRGLAYRKSQEWRQKAKVRRMFKLWARKGGTTDPESKWLQDIMSDASVGKKARTRANCSCGMCVRSRRMWGPGFKEARDLARTGQELAEAMDQGLAAGRSYYDSYARIESDELDDEIDSKDEWLDYDHWDEDEFRDHCVIKEIL